MKIKENFNLLNTALLLSVASFIIFLVIRIVLTFSYSPDIGGIENNVIYSICKVLNGKSLYGNPEDNNFDITQYTPLYYVLNIAICKVFHLSPINNLHGIYIIARMLSLVLNLVGTYFIYKLLYKVFFVDRKIALISAFIYFIHLTRFHFAARPDSLFSFSFILIIYLFCLYFKKSKPSKGFDFYIPFFIAATSVFIKQTGIQYLIIFPLFFLLTSQYVNFIKICIFFSITMILFILSFYFIYGNNFFLNIVGGINNGSSLLHSYDRFSNFFLRYQLIFVVGVILSFLFFDIKNKMEIKFLSFNILFLFLFALLSSSKIGSGINYYNEFVTTVIILATIELNGLRNEIRANIINNRIYKVLGIFIFTYICILLPNIILHKLYHEDARYILISKEHLNNEMIASKFLKQKLDQNKNLFVLSFNPNITSMLADRAVFPNKDFITNASPFNYRNFYSNIKNGKIKYIVYNKNNPSYKFLNANFVDYKQIYNENSFVILENNCR